MYYRETLIEMGHTYRDLLLTEYSHIDWYKFYNPDNRRRLRVISRFNHDSGNLDISIFDNKGNKYGDSRSNDDNERLTEWDSFEGWNYLKVSVRRGDWGPRQNRDEIYFLIKTQVNISRTRRPPLGICLNSPLKERDYGKSLFKEKIILSIKVYKVYFLEVEI